MYSFTLNADAAKGVQHLIKNGGLHTDVESQLKDTKNAGDALAIVKGVEQTEAVQTLVGTHEKITADEGGPLDRRYTGSFTARLSVNGKIYAQPFTVKPDPRAVRRT